MNPPYGLYHVYNSRTISPNTIHYNLRSLTHFAAKIRQIERPQLPEELHAQPPALPFKQLACIRQ